MLQEQYEANTLTLVDFLINFTKAMSGEIREEQARKILYKFYDLWCPYEQQTHAMERRIERYISENEWRK